MHLLLPLLFFWFFLLILFFTFSLFTDHRTSPLSSLRVEDIQIRFKASLKKLEKVLLPQIGAKKGLLIRTC